MITREEAKADYERRRQEIQKEIDAAIRRSQIISAQIAILTAILIMGITWAVVR